MNYKKIHDALIERARKRVYDRKIHHKHHIIPTHEDLNSTETVPLTFKEHKLIHYLRWRITGTIGNKLAYLRFKGMKEEFYKEKAKEGGKKGGAKTKELKSGIFSVNYDRSKETSRRWKNNILTAEMAGINSENSKKMGLLSVASGKGIFSKDYDRSQTNKNVWNSLTEKERSIRIEKLKNNAVKGGVISRDNNCGFHGLTAEIRKKNCSKGGKAHKGKRWMNKNGKNTRVTTELLPQYLNDGWGFGIISKKDYVNE